MQTNRSIEPPDLGSLPGGGNGGRGPFARLLSALRGDKYMADAYEPAWSALTERHPGTGVLREDDDDGELAAAVRSAVEPRPIGAAHAAPAGATPKER
jgi:hypothetical protein